MDWLGHIQMTSENVREIYRVGHNRHEFEGECFP